ncbi:nucleotide sugar dehydrogenase [Roseomonas xinghualingensis]|uniref:nucleotide sugar dehydrogenase n=1 Tax=Roseomonas xinghualingensis TaxID=2986475 RepID=UPI0021F22221|nr:nucleotide sugar dehydrogenase [Roseomonas sp. SXEYE001]MCV4206151.1 nucleotide sugar dehydrogenase [Roseomonas sp. SXEYE001]
MNAGAAITDKISWREVLSARLAAREARIGIIGLGYAGLPLALRFAELGFPVEGFDTDLAKVEAINTGRSPVHGIPDARIAASGMRAHATAEAAAACDALVICVPTPIGPHKEPDLSAVRDTLAALAPYLRPGQAIALESTTYPGTTEELVLPAIARAGLHIGEDAFAIYSPEREDPGNPDGTVARIPKLVGGATPNCLAIAQALYAPVAGSLVPVSSLAVAELAKCYENVFRAVNIGLVNELKRISHAMGIDVHEVIDAAATKPFGFMPFRPGPGLGGHCIPVDPYYLAWKARELHVPSDFVELAGRVNDAMPGYVVARLRNALDDRGMPLRGARILLLGLAYKPGVPDTRESPAVEIFRLLEERGAQLAYHDPLVPRFPATRRLAGTSPDLDSVPLTEAILAAQDAVILVTPQPGMDLELVRRAAPLIIDTRGALRGEGPGTVVMA